MANEFWLISYVLGILGSTSFGYLILRYGVPDFRTLSDESKLGISGIMGIGIFALSYFGSVFFSPLTLWQFLAGLTLMGVVVLGIKNNTLIPQEVKVAVPVVRLADLPDPTIASGEIIEEPKILDRRVFSEKKIKERVEEEVVPEKTAKDEREFRASRKRRREIKKEVEAAKKPVTAEAPRPRLESKGRERYLRRRGGIIKQVKIDLTKPKITKEGVVSPALEIKAEDALGLGEGLDLSDLENVGSLEDLSEISDISIEDLGDVSLESLAGLSETQKIPKEKGAKCPNCQKLRGTIVYCPYCGNGFCSDCSTGVKRKGELIHYKCPTCAKEVIVKDTIEKEKKPKKKEEPKEKPLTLSADRPRGTDSYRRGKYKPG